MQLDPITSTDLERELLRRFEEDISSADLYAPVADYLDNYDFTKTKDVQRFKDALGFGDDGDIATRKALLDVLLDADIDDPAVLRKRLERLEKFDALMDDLVQPLASLQTLATTTE